MVPLVVVAHLEGAIARPNPAYCLDSLLDWATYPERGIEHPCSPEEWEATRTELPIARSACGRFHLVSEGIFDTEQTDNRWINRRFPLPEAMALGDAKLRRVDVKAGPQKSYRLPLETLHLLGDVIVWFCVGDAQGIRDLLRWVTHLGKRRAVGLGRVARWEVELTSSWGEGFPLLREGVPTRALPLDHPGIAGGEQRIGRFTFPYHYRWLEELVACP